MTRSRRPRLARDAFGASLLDMMCCGLGAAIVVFVLRQMESDRKVVRAETTAEWMRFDAITRVSEAQDAREAAEQSRAEAVTATERAEQKEREANKIGEDIRARQRATVFGLPPLRGNVSVVVDRSLSMGDYDKLDVALRSVESVVLEGMFVKRLRLVSFSSGSGEQGHRVHFDENPGDPGTDRRRKAIDQALRSFRGALRVSGGTELPAALNKELAWVEQVGGGTILLVTDGISSGEIEGSIRLIGEYQARNPGKPLVIHSISLVGSGDGVGDLDRDPSRQPGFVLSLLANETRGTVVSIPMPLQTSGR
jgi:hypothetical protein